MRFSKIVLIVAFLFIPFAADASVKEYTLKNGLKVLIIEDHKAPLATFQIWYRVGSRDEPAGKTGISHLLEHMMFKGTRKYGSKEFSGIIKRNGGTDNAFTTKDYTMYFQTLSSDRVGISIELEADRMADLLLDPKEVESEKNVVMEERRMRYEDDPQNLLYEEVIASAFKAHPYRWPVIGWMSDIESIGREDLFKHYKTYYSPDNALIIISGDVNPDNVIVDVRKNFEIIPNAGIDRADKKTLEPEQRGERRIYLKKEAELPYILMAYHTPSFPHDDSFALEVLSAVLSGGKSSIFYRNIVREKQIALNAFADYNALQRDPFLFVLGATAAPQKNIGDIEKAIYEEIEKIKETPLSEKEMQKAKNQIEASFVFAQDSSYSKALYAGMFAMLGDRRLMERYLDGIRKVRPEDVQAAAKKYLTDDNKTVGILVPVKRNEK